MRSLKASFAAFLLSFSASTISGMAIASDQKWASQKCSKAAKSPSRTSMPDSKVELEKFLVTKADSPISFSLMLPKSVSVNSSRNYYSRNFFFFEPQRKRQERPFLLLSIVPQKKDHMDSARESLQSAMLSIRKTHRLNWKESAITEFKLAEQSFVKQSWSATESGALRPQFQHGLVVAGTHGSTLILGLSTCQSQNSVELAEEIFRSLHILN